MKYKDILGKDNENQRNNNFRNIQVLFHDFIFFYLSINFYPFYPH